MPRPMNSEGTCPVMHMTGALAPYAEHRAAAAFSIPGPGTTEKTPFRPVDLA